MRPLLSATLDDPKNLPYPVFVSPKYDGIRALTFAGQVVSRNLKPIRNKYIQQCLKWLPEGMDGELVVGPPNEGLVFNRTSSGVMSASGEPDFRYYIFDVWKSNNPYYLRNESIPSLINHSECDSSFCIHVPQIPIEDAIGFTALEEAILEDGYEGVMARGMHSRYKEGRATHNEGIIWKYKRFRDGEARIESLEEGEKNLNEAKTDALGYKTRSTFKDFMVSAGMVGAIIGRDLMTGEVIRISAGKMEHNERIYYWNNQDQIIGKIAKYKTFDYGKLAASRFCTFQGFRHPDDV